MITPTQIQPLLAEVGQGLQRQREAQTKDITNLLSGAAQLRELQEQDEKLRGEKFNVFSILQLEYKENRTHSAFLGELLNPDGSHLKGNIFLKLFLEVIKNKNPDETLDTESTSVTLEQDIGEVDHIKKTGGRIDIYIVDGKGRSISIENKIHADDQHTQIERYANHKENNTVYYLTPTGREPSDDSAGDLINGKHYFTISYREDIRNWLTLVHKESADHPILRETVRQYILLIQKLTNTMNKTHEKALHDLIVQNCEAAEYVADNFDAAKISVVEKIRASSVASLKEAKLNDSSKSIGQAYRVENYKFFGKSYNAGISIKPNRYENCGVYFLVAFTNNVGEDEAVFVCIFDEYGKGKYYVARHGEEAKSQNDKHYPIYEHLGPVENRHCIWKSSMLMKLHSKTKFSEKFVNDIVSQTTEFIKLNQESLLKFLENQKNEALPK